MALIGIVGESGTGKSTSFRNLDPKTTFIIQVLNKPLPIQGWKKNYIEGVNLARLSKWRDIVNKMKEVAASKKFKTLIVDDAGHLMSKEFLDRASEGGYTKFGEIGQHMYFMLVVAEKIMDDIHVVFTFHPEMVQDSSGNVDRKIRTVGKMLDEKYTLEGAFTVLLYSVFVEDNDKYEYKFVTNRVSGYPAKSPMGMFKERLIDNDLSKVIKTIEAYEEGIKE